MLKMWIRVTLKIRVNCTNYEPTVRNNAQSIDGPLNADQSHLPE